jgi:hypothetical protein
MRPTKVLARARQRSCQRKYHDAPKTPPHVVLRLKFRFVPLNPAFEKCRACKPTYTALRSGKK